MKKKAIIISVSVLAVLAAVIIPLTLIPRSAVSKIAVIPLSGPITTGDYSLLSGSVITPNLVRNYLTEAEEDKAVKAIIFRIESRR